ncbi:MAG TPA: glycosyltransferase family 2 protein, partial [Solirubrobacteraceae bacterium]|nr:glycosyltransferase family 2 protein [Solirubrobacteraceae bacterium]
NGDVIVVDGDPDRSAAEPFAELRQAHPDVSARYIASEPGMTLQRNKGIDASRGNVVVFIDDDCTVEPDLFEALARVYRDRSVIGATGLILEPANARFASNGRLRRLLIGGGQEGTMNRFGFRRPLVDLERAHEMQFMYGPLMSARREYAADVRFDESLGAYALGEDDDFSYRLSRRGRLRYEPTAVVHHHEMGRRGMDLRKINRIHVVNKTYLFHKNFPVTLRARACFAALLGMLFIHRVLNREWSGLLGLTDGLKEVRRSRRRDRARDGARPRRRQRALAALALPALVAGLLVAPLAQGVGANHRDIDRAALYRTRPGDTHRGAARTAGVLVTRDAQRSPVQHAAASRRDRVEPDGDADDAQPDIDD